MSRASLFVRVAAAWLISGFVGALIAIVKPAGWVCQAYWHRDAFDGMAQALVCVTAAALIAPRRVVLGSVPPLVIVAAFYPLWEYWGLLDRSYGWASPRWYMGPLEPVSAVMGLGLLLTYSVHVFPTTKARVATLLSGVVLTSLVWMTYYVFGFHPG